VRELFSLIEGRPELNLYAPAAAVGTTTKES